MVTALRFQSSHLWIPLSMTAAKLFLLFLYAPINVKSAGGGGGQGMGWGGFDYLCRPGGGAFDWYCSPRGGDICIFPRPMWGYLTADSDERDRDRTYVSRFQASRMSLTVWKDLEIMEASGGQREQAKGEWISLFCLQSLFVLACFWLIEHFKILWYQSKRK